MSQSKFGIFLGYAPEQSISHDGLGRLFAFIIRGVIEKGGEVVLALPLWSKSDILELLKEFSIDEHKVEWITTPRVPFLLRLRSFFNAPGRRKSRFMKFFQRIRVYFRIFSKKTFSFTIRSLSKSFLFVGLIFLFYSVFFLLTLPFWIVLSILGIILRFGLKKHPRNFKSFFFRQSNYFKVFLATPLKAFKSNKVLINFYEEMRLYEFEVLMAKINRKADVIAWLVPSLFWPEVENICAPKVIVVPDLVYMDFPVPFASDYWKRSIHRMEKSLTVGDHLICYSNHVKRHQLCEKFGIASSKIIVIPHACIDSKVDLHKGKYAKSASQTAAREILKKHMQEYFVNDPYLQTFDLSCSEYFVYTSQMRHHKNILSLLKAYEKLLREELINVKLVLTAKPLETREIKEYIISRRLCQDVLFLPSLPAQTLAALNHLAICSVNPTLFEGGFPFTFSEAYSVGTPSIMGRIPVVMETMQEIIQENPAFENMLFDPYNIKDMCDRMKWAVENREALFELQAELYARFKRRTWMDVAEEYQNVLERTAREFAHVYQK